MMASRPRETRQWQLANRPVDEVRLDGPEAVFKLGSAPLPDLEESQVLVKSMYISNDAAQRVWISALDDQPRRYMPPINIGDVMRARSLGEVIESRSNKVPKGSIVQITGGWAEYTIQPEERCVVIPSESGFPVTQYLGALGITGLTAYYGLVDIVKAGSDDIVVVSGAAGATGSMAIQIAKNILGCKKVIGIAGADEKCQWVRDLGADECLNYKSPNFHDELIKATEDEVDVFFDNVGGDILDFMFTRLRKEGRVALCGAVARYNSLSSQTVFKHFEDVITQRLTIRGFVVLDYLHQLPKVIQILIKAAQEGKVKIGEQNETVVPTTFEDIPKVWLSLYYGANRGKLVTKLVG